MASVVLSIGIKNTINNSEILKPRNYLFTPYVEINNRTEGGKVKGEAESGGVNRSEGFPLFSPNFSREGKRKSQPFPLSRLLKEV